ncbi:MAG TPA: mechanosensitive ion channel family protein [Terriglobia bacterium]
MPLPPQFTLPNRLASLAPFEEAQPTGLQGLARALHIPPTVIDIAAVGTLLVAAVLMAFGLRHLCRRYARRLARTWGEFVFLLLEPLPIPLLVLAALYAALEWFNLPRKWDHVGSEAILVLVIVVLFYVPAKVITLLLRRVKQKQPELERVTQPASFFVRVFFSLVAVIVILQNLGIHLTALWTTLGVGSVAVALALQDTLGNFFAGLYLLADRPVNPGDYIRVEPSGPEGFVVRIGWGSTWLRNGQNNMVVQPNSTLAKAVITNFSFPEERLQVSVQVGVAYGTDPRRVEKLLIDIVRQLEEEGFEGVLKYPEPTALLAPGFGASSLDFTLNVQARRLSDQTRVQSELRKRILERFSQEGITMPFPTQSLVLDSSTLTQLRKEAAAPMANSWPQEKREAPP